MGSLATIAEFVTAHAELAYIAVFMLAFLEAVPVIGAALPGSILILAVSTLVPVGAVKMWPLLLATILGGILGDGFSYWLGYRYRETILRCWPLNRYPELEQKSRAFIERHGGKSIFLARFTWGRAFVPVIAGTLHMPQGRFYAANILSAMVWAPALILPGIVLGASLTLAGAAAGRLALLLVVIVAMFLLLISGLRLIVRRGPSLVAAVEAQLRQWSARRNTWLARQIRSLVDPERSEARALVLWAGVVIAAAWLFFGVLEDVATGDPLVRVDGTIYRALQGLRTPAGDAFMIGITELGDTVVTTSVTIVVFLWLAWQRAWRTAFYWAAAVGFAATLNTITKFAIHRARPDDLAYTGASLFSFPSGHATVNAVLYGFFAFIITRQLRPAWRLPIFIAVASFAALIAFSRLYLGAHWFSDVVGSIAFATAWVVVLGFAYVRHHEKPFDRRILAMVACAAVVLAGGFNVFRTHAADTERYAIRYETRTIAAADWWTTAWETLPAYRVDLSGEDEEPLTLQWAGTHEGLKNRLLASGWQEPERWTPSTTLAWLVMADPRKLPVIPSLEAGRMPSLTLIRVSNASPDSRWVLRLWAADYTVRNGASYPLWLGSVVEERISRPLSFVSIAQTNPEVRRPLEILAQSLKGGRYAQRGLSTERWDGRVLLAQENFVSPSAAQNQRVKQ